MNDGSNKEEDFCKENLNSLECKICNPEVQVRDLYRIVDLYSNLVSMNPNLTPGKENLRNFDISMMKKVMEFEGSSTSESGNDIKNTVGFRVFTVFIYELFRILLIVMTFSIQITKTI